ncbi:MAG: hypothetical protein JXA19_03085 [Anaerolineales bacterium]|nr:hypothetical protein [Anaerolineales bacterium]
MKTVLDSLNDGLKAAMQAEERVYLLGEDLLDPYGGAFKVSKGLSSLFPKRVITTPISEAAITGIAGGMALRGLRPVLEIMFGDFATLISDAVINSISKFQWMYNGQVSVPMVVRLPMGGRRGYGPTHSQNLEKLFMGISGIEVWAPSRWGNPGELLKTAILDVNQLVIFVENKLQYLETLQTCESQNDFDVKVLPGGEVNAPFYRITLKNAPSPSISLIAYGYTASLAEEAMLSLAYEEEIFCELLVPTRLSPFGDEKGLLPLHLMESVRQTKQLLCVEESSLTLGWGAEILARVSETLPGKMLSSQRLAAKETPIPASMKQEAEVLPQVKDIVVTVKKMVNG